MSVPLRPTIPHVERPRSRLGVRALLLGCALTALAACDRELDWDMRPPGEALNTTEAARAASGQRPQADSRGVISYPNYQVAVAQRGDTVGSLAARVGLQGEELARYNGLSPDMALRPGEVMALPRRVSEAGGTLGTGSVLPGGQIDITTLAGGAIDRAGPSSTAPAPTASQPQGVLGREPIRHQVLRGETAYTVARLYNVSAKALADWNGLGPDLAIREGQFLMIPVPGEEALDRAGSTAHVSAPGVGTDTPEPPSASKPLPVEQAAAAAPASPDLAASQTAASSSRFALPADGAIIRAYAKGKNEGIDIGAPAGAPVRAAADGTVAAITKDTDQVQIIVVRHADNMLTIYANIDGIKVAKGAAVKRGQTIATVSNANPAFVHFEIRKGADSVDPMPYLQ